MEKLKLIIVICIMLTTAFTHTANGIEAYNDTLISGLLPVNDTYQTTDGTNNYINFMVLSPATADYHVGFWLLPAEYPNGEYTKFTVLVNGNQIGSITPTTGNWQYAMLNEESTISLTSGVNTVSLATVAPEMPTVEFIRVAENSEDAVIPSTAYDDFLAEAINGKDISMAEEYCTELPAEPNAHVTPDFQWDMTLRYSFYKQVSFTKGESIFITSNSEKEHVIDLMYCGEFQEIGFPPSPGVPVIPSIPTNDIGTGPIPGTPKIFVDASSEEMQGMNWLKHSEKIGGTSNQVATLKVPSIPKSGVYMLRLRTTDNSIQGTANLQIDNRYYYADCPISLSYRATTMAADHVEYATMTKCDNADADDPMIFIHGKNADCIVGWNDNGKSSEIEEYGLNKYDAYISQVYNVKTSGISVSSASSSNPLSKCTVITRMAVGTSQNDNAILRSPSSGNKASVVEMPEANDGVTLSKLIVTGENLRASAANAIKTIMAYDTMGHLLASVNVNSTEITVPLAQLKMENPGVYLVTVTTENSTKSSKILIK